MISLRNALASIGESVAMPFAWRKSFGGRTPSSLGVGVAGMTDPQVERWKEVGVALKGELSEEAQGVTTDGLAWYACSNDSKKVVRFNDQGMKTNTYIPSPHVVKPLTTLVYIAGKPVPVINAHFGAPAYHDGWIYVPIQKPYGVWRFTTDDKVHEWHKARALSEENMFPWCAIHPVTGLLYTCNYDKPNFLRAYDRNTLAYLPQHDIPLGKTSLSLDKVQGGVFTSHGRVLIVRWDFNAVFCFSALNGYCFGAKKLGDFGSVGSEVESVTVRPWRFGDRVAFIHIMELDNDYLEDDDLYLRSYFVPDPDRL